MLLTRFVRQERAQDTVGVAIAGDFADLGFDDRKGLRGLQERPYEERCQSGRDRDTLVVVTADHGEALWEHGEVTHGLFTYDSTLRVPLFVRFPDGRHAGTEIPQPVALVDLAPSILTWLGVAPPEGLDGRLLPVESEASDTDERWIYFENRGPAHLFGWSPLRGVVSAGLKFVRAPRPELYDLREDPHEMKNLYEDPTYEKTKSELKTKLISLQAKYKIPQE